MIFLTKNMKQISQSCVCCRMEHRANLLWIPPDSDYNIKEVSKAASKQYKSEYNTGLVFLLQLTNLARAQS